MDNPNEVGSQDRNRISVSEDYELQYWSEKFGISRTELREAVEAVGNDPDEVEKYLNDNE